MHYFTVKTIFFRRNSPYVFVYSMTITNWAEIWEWFSIKGSLYTKQRYVRRNGEHGEGKLQSETCEQEANREIESIQERREPFGRWIYSLSNMSLQTTTRACNVNTKIRWPEFDLSYIQWYSMISTETFHINKS